MTLRPNFHRHLIVRKVNQKICTIKDFSKQHIEVPEHGTYFERPELRHDFLRIHDTNATPIDNYDAHRPAANIYAVAHFCSTVPSVAVTTHN